MRPGAALPPLLSQGAPRHSPGFHSSVSGCPGAALHLVFTLLSPGPRRSPTPDFPSFCVRVRPGSALHLISSILSPGAPAQPYT
ncbi:hypothetical protein CDAR_88851 [Caerostris darwini]|uniref:Uncharacterized protein n=1 Tax=Caerostris darwini TaxID=1538125 RepID=A0AAV4QHV4_9ARAC|nr:hypothetical protein CDAR_88851 [Caerostris darwini]